MRILVDLGSHITGDPAIMQVERVPVMGDEGRTSINGRYLLPITPNANIVIDGSSYVLDGAGEIDGDDVSSQSMAWLLAMYPSFENVYFNPLLTDDHVDELDPAATVLIDGVVHGSRVQTGRQPGGPFASGQAPCMTAILGQNDAMTPPRPGVVVTDEIDIGPFTLDELGDPVGADEFLVYWKLYDFETTHDVRSTFGATAGLNTPAIKQVEEMDQEPDGFTAYLTIDNGTHWTPVGLAEPLGFCDKSTTFRLAFVNTAPTKAYIATFAVLF